MPDNKYLSMVLHPSGTSEDNGVIDLFSILPRSCVPNTVVGRQAWDDCNISGWPELLLVAHMHVFQSDIEWAADKTVIVIVNSLLNPSYCRA